MQLRFEASVCAAIPVVKVLRESMIANDVSAVLGIVNGTTNFILSAMAGGQDYASALARAQELGYAEADPTEDVNGADAAAKIAILASIAFHTRVTIEDVPFEGIEALEAIDSAVAQELGYRIKLIASAERLEGGVAARVHPTLVPDGHPLATIEGSFNAVMLRGSAIREITLAGPGAGGDETASAVIGDVMTVLGTSGTGFFTHDGYFRQVPIVPEADVPSAFYLRLDVLDAPGVLAQISRVLADQQVSIESVIQRAFDGRAAAGRDHAPGPRGPLLRGRARHPGARRRGRRPARAARAAPRLGALRAVHGDRDLPQRRRAVGVPAVPRRRPRCAGRASSTSARGSRRASTAASS